MSNILGTFVMKELMGYFQQDPFNLIEQTQKILVWVSCIKWVPKISETLTFLIP